MDTSDGAGPNDHAVPPGINAGRVTKWFTTSVAEVTPPLSFSQIAGGRSNLTYTVVDSAGRSWVLRRPPLGKVLATAHDMGREHRIISALTTTEVPVPPAVGFCDDTAVNDAPFYVMDYVDGYVLRNQSEATNLSVEARQQLTLRLGDVLAHIHAVDPDAVGLGDLGRKEGYLERQLRRWSRQWDQSKTRELPLVEEVHAKLTAGMPVQRATSIVHGDYRLDNCIVSSEGQIEAVLDWELCTLGDPLADVGLLMVYWSEPGDGFAALGDSATSLEGFGSRHEVVQRYAATRQALSPETSSDLERDLENIGYYTAFGYWKLACILEGVLSRYQAGVMGDGGDGGGFANVVEVLAEAAQASLAGKA